MKENLPSKYFATVSLYLITNDFESKMFRSAIAFSKLKAKTGTSNPYENKSERYTEIEIQGLSHSKTSDLLVHHSILKKNYKKKFLLKHQKNSTMVNMDERNNSHKIKFVNATTLDMTVFFAMFSNEVME